MGTPSSSALSPASPSSSPPPPASTGDQTFIPIDSTVPPRAGPRLVQHEASTSLSADSTPESDPEHSEPRMEVRQFPTDDGTVDAVTITEHRSPKADDHAKPASRQITEALLRGDRGALHRLLAEHASLTNAPLPDFGAPPLVVAVQLGHRELVEELIATPGIHLDARDGRHRNAVLVACEAGNLDLTRLLVRCGANVQTHSRDSTPLIAACVGHHPELLRYILKKTPRALIDFCPHATDTALTRSVICANIDAVRQLLDRGANPNRPGTNAMTPLHRAAEFGELAIAELLIRRGAVQRKSSFGYPLDLACRNGWMPMMELLLTAPPASDEWQADVLTSAIIANQPELLAWLLAHGISPNAVSQNQTSALMIASELGNIKAVEVLLTRGANAAHRSLLGHSALSKAIENRQSRDLILLLLSAMPDKIMLERGLALQLVQRAKRRQDFRILNELAIRQWVDRGGNSYDVRNLLN